jgi:hypothetical protein
MPFTIWLVGLNPKVLSVIRRSSLGKIFGQERMHFSLEVAVGKHLKPSEVVSLV